MRAIVGFLLLLWTLALLLVPSVAACNACVVSPLPVGVVRGKPIRYTPKLPWLPPALDAQVLIPWGIFMSLNHLSTHLGHVNSSSSYIARRRRRRSKMPGLWRMDSDEMDDGFDDDADAEESPIPVTAAMVGAIGFYKRFISPLLPPACRFVPTCSQYGVQAIQEFGPTKGALLTAWRLMRCTPFGGKGYDPPQWPPVPYNYGSY